MYVLQDSDGTIYPADRCSWKSNYSTADQQYLITDAMFYGLGASATTLNTPAQLGFIGKSGRFVAISGE